MLSTVGSGQRAVARRRDTLRVNVTTKSTADGSKRGDEPVSMRLDLLRPARADRALSSEVRRGYAATWNSTGAQRMTTAGDIDDQDAAARQRLAAASPARRAFRGASALV